MLPLSIEHRMRIAALAVLMRVYVPFHKCAGKVRDLYKEIIRVFWKGNHVLIIGTDSPFARKHLRPGGESGRQRHERSLISCYPARARAEAC